MMSGQRKGGAAIPGRGKWAWVSGFNSKRKEEGERAEGLHFDLSSLVQQGFVRKRAFARFQRATGLANFAWRVVYSTALRAEVDSVQDVMRRARGFVVFIHGWDASNAIWEDLPALVCERNPRLVSFVLDVNGFGGSPFLSEMPELEQCDPLACMGAIEHWIELLRLRSLRATKRRKVFTFVGHSMGGAALFYKDDEGWHDGEFGLYAIAPALLHTDGLRKGFYKWLGVGIGAGWQQEIFNRLKARLAPALVNELISGASQAVKNEHVRVFERTSKGTLAQTFYAMGLAEMPPQRDTWENFRVILGDEDRLVGLAPMLRLLDELGLPSRNVKVVFGGHYLFSPSLTTRKRHGENKETVINEILQLHDWCRERQRKG